MHATDTGMLASGPLVSSRGTFSGIVSCKPGPGQVACTGYGNGGSGLFGGLSENMQWSGEREDACPGLSDSPCFRAAPLGEG